MGKWTNLAHKERLADSKLAQELIRRLLHIIELVRQAVLQMEQERAGFELIGALVKERIHASQGELAQLCTVVDFVLEGTQIDSAHQLLLVHCLAIESRQKPI